MPELIFVVGSPRSGTSYVGRALAMATDVGYIEDSRLFSQVGAHTDVHLYSRAMYPTNVFPYPGLYHQLRGCIDRALKNNRLGKTLERLLLSAQPDLTLGIDSSEQHADHVLDPVGQHEWQKLNEELTDTQRIFGFGKLAEIYLNEFAKRTGCSTVIEKTSDHLRYLPLIHKLFPEAKVVLVRREKRKCIESYFKTYGHGKGLRQLVPQRLKEEILWRQLIRDEGRELWALGQPWVTAVDFSECMSDPVQHISKLADDLGLHLEREQVRDFVSGRSKENGH